MTTAADHLRAQSARRIVDLVASDLACDKVRIVEPAPVAPADPRAAVRALRREAQKWRDAAASLALDPATAPEWAKVTT